MFEIGPEQLNELGNLCARYQVQRLDMFGSGARADFDPLRSDLDFVVTFAQTGWQGAADRYFGLLEALQLLFGRPVDLVEERAIRNRVFRQRVLRTRKPLYAA